MQRNGQRNPGRADALTNLPVSAAATFTKANNITGTFTGAFTATRVDVVTDASGKRQVQVTGLLTGVAKSADGTQTISVSETVSGILRREHDANGNSIVRPTQASCDILFLELGPINLDLLGLVLNVSQIVIDLEAQTGGGNLLGNLLCGLLGLLDIPGLLGAISNLLDLINNILNNLSAGAASPVA